MSDASVTSAARLQRPGPLPSARGELIRQPTEDTRKPGSPRSLPEARVLPHSPGDNDKHTRQPYGSCRCLPAR
jgi:hypothetical protein